MPFEPSNLDCVDRLRIGTPIAPPPTPGVLDVQNGARLRSSLTVDSWIDLTAIANPSAPAVGTARFHALTTQGFTRFEQDNEAPTNITIGRDVVFIGRNTSGSNITAGQAVYVTGATTGNVPNVAAAKADSLTTLPAVGFALDAIAINAFGQVIFYGIIASLNTSAFTAGDRLYVSATTAGSLTATAPAAPNYQQRMGTCLISGVGNGVVMAAPAPFIGGTEKNTDATAFTPSASAGGALGTTTLPWSSLVVGNASGKVTVQPSGTTGTWTMTLPTGVAGTNGFQLTDAGGDGVTSWAAAASLRAFKEVGARFDPQTALSRLLSVPVYAFHYKPGQGTQDGETEYVGVMAEDAPWAMHYQGSILNPVNTFGYAVLAIQAQQVQIVELMARVRALEAQCLVKE